VSDVQISTLSHKQLLSNEERDAWVGLIQAYAGIVRSLDDELRLLHGLPLTSFEVLAQLVLTPGHRLRMAELADLLVYTRSGVTRIVERLERDGYVKRCDAEHDGRGIYAVLTGRGFEAFEEACATHVDGLRRLFFTKLEAGELERLTDLWERLGSHSCLEREQRLRSVERDA